MIKTYIVEDEQRSVIEYHRRLSDAKECVLLNARKGLECTILALKGQYFGEGFHTHRYELKKDLSFRRDKLI